MRTEIKETRFLSHYRCFVQVWAILDGKIHCTEFFDMKDPVRNLSVTNTFACFTLQSAGLKVIFIVFHF